MPGIAPIPGMCAVPATVPGCGLIAATVVGGIAAGRPGIAAGIGRPRCVASIAGVATAAPVDECRLELNETKVAQPSTSATAAPAARPTLSRRDFWLATIGNAFWLATTSA